MPKSIDATQFRLFVCIALATLLTWAIVIADLARGGRPDPPSLRAAATLLDGPWQFQAGNDPRWAGADANAHANDSDWETIDLTAAPGCHDGDVGLPDFTNERYERKQTNINFSGRAMFQRGSASRFPRSRAATLRHSASRSRHGR
jgi:hypothetical protein